ncbi:MAG: hypothetical protein ACI9OJ_004206, partial [Myxococcota bacterium]
AFFTEISIGAGTTGISAAVVAAEFAVAIRNAGNVVTLAVRSAFEPNLAGSAGTATIVRSAELLETLLHALRSALEEFVAVLTDFAEPAQASATIVAALLASAVGEADVRSRVFHVRRSGVFRSCVFRSCVFGACVFGSCVFGACVFRSCVFGACVGYADVFFSVDWDGEFGFVAVWGIIEIGLREVGRGRPIRRRRVEWGGAADILVGSEQFRCAAE